jgi:hypothetical protein
MRAVPLLLLAMTGALVGAPACRTQLGRPTGSQTAVIKKTAADYRRNYEAVFARETTDIGWAKAAEKMARAKLPKLLPNGSTIRSVECHSTLCRLETAHRNKENYFLFGQNAFMSEEGRLWNAATFSSPLDDRLSDPVMISYIAREGHELPRID